MALYRVTVSFDVEADDLDDVGPEIERKLGPMEQAGTDLTLDRVEDEDWEDVTALAVSG